VDCLFVGAGAAAEAYAADLDRTALDLVGVCDLAPERAAGIAEAADATAYTDLDEMLAVESAPLVVVLTSHAAHAAVTRTALSAGRHVFSQKPLALDPDEAWSLVALAREQGVALDCAPVAVRHPPQRRVARLLADGRLGAVQLAYAHAHVGRVTEWHDDPESFLAVGPLYDGAVYPLTLLTAWFGPVERVRSADAAERWPARETATPEAPTHVEATLEFVGGLQVRLTASLYAPHRSREFNSLELHGDDGSLYLRDCGGGTEARDVVQFGRVGRGYTPVPPTHATADGGFADGPAALARRVDERRARHSGRRERDDTRDTAPYTDTGAARAAHVVAVCDAVERAAEAGTPVTLGDPAGGTGDPEVERSAREADTRVRERAVAPPPYGSGTRTTTVNDDASAVEGSGASALRLPPVGLDTGGRPAEEGSETVPPADAETVATALDAGCRLFVGIRAGSAATPSPAQPPTTSAESVATALGAPGAPSRETLHLAGTVSLSDPAVEADAIRETLDVERLDGLLLDVCGPDGHDPDDRRLVAAWRETASLVAAGQTRTVGLSGVGVETLRRLATETDTLPATVVVDSDPADPSALRAWCHDRGVRLLAASPPATDDDWTAANGVVRLTRARTRERLVSGLAVGLDNDGGGG
jgi:alcohol dehydrogenase (NADP+)